MQSPCAASARPAHGRGAGGGPRIAPAEPGREKRGFAEQQLRRLADCIDRGLDEVRAEQETIRARVADVAAVAATLDPGSGDGTVRQQRFEELADRFKETDDPVRQHMARVMLSFVAGLFVGVGKFEEWTDNLDLERWFRLPKSHERRIHGRRHEAPGNPYSP